MTVDLLKAIDCITPLDCFAVQCELLYAKSQPSFTAMRRNFLLPSTSKLLNENSFAEVGVAWNEQAVYCGIFFNKPLDPTDKVELFLDTRDLKTVSFIHRFCHHFLILPQTTVGETPAKEVTAFRTEDKHSLCLSEDIQVEVQDKRKSYAIKVTIPAYCLHGYDPKQFFRIAMNYRLHAGGNSQHFSSSYSLIEQQPRYWASCYLTEKRGL